MIKINLALKKQAAALDVKDKTGAASTQLNMESAKELVANPQFRKVILLVVVVVLGYYMLDGYEQDQLALVDKQIQKITADNQKLKSDLAKTAGYEAEKKQFDADEELIKSKLATIQKLIADRADPPKLLLSFSSSIPKDVWMQEYEMTSKDIHIKGSSLGFEPVTDFVKALGENELVTDVKLDDSQKAKDAVAGDVTTFSVEAKRK
jgi:Tfp pilus assembly protein PilN